MSVIDEYIKNVIQKGGKGSELLRALCAPTLENCEYVDVIKHGQTEIAVLRIPEEHHVVVHSTGGDPKKKDLAEHAASLVDRLVEQAETFEARPVAFANVIDLDLNYDDIELSKLS